MRVQGRRLLVIALLLGAAASACAEQVPDPPPGARRITIVTPDGERLDAVQLGQGADVAVLSHGANGTKEDFYALASAFADAGWRVIAYDARGVGASTGSRGEDRDVDLRAVVEHARRTSPGSLVLAGGSLGASLSIAMADELDATAVVSLSAPASSFGALQAARELDGAIPFFVAAAEDDEPFASDAIAIAEIVDVEPTIVTGDGHGTGMFVDHPDLIDRVVGFAIMAIGVG